MPNLIPFSPWANTEIVLLKSLFATQALFDLPFAGVISAFQPSAFQASAFQTLTSQQLSDSFRLENAQLFVAYRQLLQQQFTNSALALTNVIASVIAILGQIKTNLQFIVSTPLTAAQVASATVIINNGFADMQNTEIQNAS
jgi:hypothetical protein